jgi:hypothetical protein
MKNKNKLNNKNERNFMTTNSKCRLLLCLALPLTVAAGYASDSNSPKDTNAFIDVPTPIVATVSARQTADITINNEIFNLVMADTSISYNLSVSVNKGVVTVSDSLAGGRERQRVVNEIWDLAGVNQVRDEHGADLASTATGKAVAVR